MSSNILSLTTSQLIADIAKYKAGERILLSGIIYTARDCAHKRLVEMIQKGEVLPFDLKNSIIYYCGPTPAKPGNVIGSCGPTTSYRMDEYAPLLTSLGVKGTIGKGPRSDEVKEALKKYQGIYLTATGGVAALLSRKVRKAEILAFKDLGPEAIYRFEILEFPLIVAIDIYGNDVFNVEIT